jgi:hypothetical protein
MQNVLQGRRSVAFHLPFHSTCVSCLSLGEVAQMMEQSDLSVKDAAVDTL